LIPCCGTSPQPACLSSSSPSASGAALLPPRDLGRPRGIPAAMWAALGLGEDAVVLSAVSLQAVSCWRLQIVGQRRTAVRDDEERSQFGAGLIWNALIVWRGFLQNVICSQPTSLNSGRREYKIL
jgi:hypothetical protein